jgi:hypothetical protein
MLEYEGHYIFLMYIKIIYLTSFLLVYTWHVFETDLSSI